MSRKKMKVDDKFDIRLRVSSKLHEQVQEIADKEETTVAAYLRSLVIKDIESRKAKESNS